MVYFSPLVGNVQIVWLIGGLMVVIFVDPAVVNARSAGPQAGDCVGVVHHQQRSITVQTEGRSQGQHKRLVVHHGILQCLLW